MLLGLLAALGSAVAFGLVAVVQAIAARRSLDGGLRRFLREPFLWLTLAGYALGWLLHLVAIAELPLYLAQSGIVLGLVITAVTAAIWLGESLTRTHWLAVVGTAIALAVMVAGGGTTQDEGLPTALNVVLIAGIPALAGLGLVANRLDGDLAAFSLGVLGGLAYSGTPLATRALVTDPGIGLNAHTFGYGAILGLYGLLGFWLYSVALQRAPIAVSTGPLVVVETVVPTLVGLLWLGDTLRPGWGPAVGVALAASLVGAWVLGSVDLSDGPAPAAIDRPDWMGR